MSHPQDTDALFHCECGEWHYKSFFVASDCSWKWKLESKSDLAFVRDVEVELAKAGWHVALGGSVLHKGWSSKDVDLIVFPHKKRSSQSPRKTALHAALARCNMTMHLSRAALRRLWKKDHKVLDNKWVEVWKLDDGRRVDVLVLS